MKIIWKIIFKIPFIGKKIQLAYIIYLVKKVYLEQKKRGEI